MTPHKGVAAEGEAGPPEYLCIGFVWVALLAPAASLGGNADGGQVTRFDISRQRADQALIEFAEQADVTFVFPAEKVRKVMTNEVRGEFKPKEAIEKLLAGTGLHLSVRADGAWTVGSNNGSTEQGESVKKRGLWAIVIGVLTASAGTDATADQETAVSQLQEIFVTAQRRTERVQDVPMSIGVLTRDDIDRKLLVNAEDYLRGMSGVNQEGRAMGQAIVIRGIENTLNYQNWASGVTTGVYLGEVPLTSSAGGVGSNIDVKLVDIERVEVLKGPQGTAFGSSAMGGVVRTIPVSPDLDAFEGRLASGYSSTSGAGGRNYNFQGIANAPLVEGKLAIRGVAYVFSDSGYYRGRSASDPAYQAGYYANVAPFATVSDEEEVGAYYASGVRIAALYRPVEDLRFTLTYLSQKSETNGQPLANSGTYEQTILHATPELVRRGQKGGSFDTDLELVNLVAEYDLGWSDLVASYSYFDGQSETVNSYSVWFDQPWTEGIVTGQTGDVGEIRLATKLDGDWDFLVGLYDENLEDDFFDEYYWDADPANSIIPGQRYLGGLVPDHRELEQTAVFGEVTWNFLPRFTLAGGARTYEYKRKAHIVTEGIFGDGDARLATDATGVSYRANLSYKPDNDSMLYANWSQGFRLGKPQAGLPSSLCDINNDGIVDGTAGITIESTKTVNSDEVDNYEIGGKFAFLDHRLAIDGAIFRMDWSGLPVSLNAPHQPEGCHLTYVANAGAARSEGVEIQIDAQATDALRIGIGGSVIHARLTESVPAANLLRGARLPAPKVTANLGLQYSFAVSGYPTSLRADAVYVGTIYDDIVTQTSVTRAGNYVKLDVSARVEVKDVDVDLYIWNLTNENAFTARAGFSGFFHAPFLGYRLRPRTVGVQLSYQF